MKIKLKILFAFTLIFAISYSFGQNKNILNQKIDSLIKSANPRPFNGSILITKNGKTEFSKIVGFENFDAKVPLKTDD